jgi:dihydrodipicolinate synthase/N-acetylneuraminate lyase
MKDFGVLVPIVTPCSKDGTIDIDALGNVCKDMLDAGCSGIFAAGSTGRGPWFSLQERHKILYAIKNIIGEKITLFAGCMESGFSGMLDNARAASDAGADAIVITAPYYFNYSLVEIEKILLDVADKSPLPVLIYDIPAYSGVNFDVDTILRLLDHANIIGVKDSSADIKRFRKLMICLQNKDDKYFFQGKENFLVESIQMGASGCVVSLLHIEPRLFVLLYHAVKSGQLAKANKIQKEIVKALDLIEEGFKIRPEDSTLFHFLNSILKARNLCTNIVLDHEGDCPAWLYDKSMQALEIYREALNNI